ncbi:MAG: hypothetical protein KF819_20755 [Labilithrix sp.]|nr:hypothetical protein [Labilithrix sp.]
MRGLGFFVAVVFVGACGGASQTDLFGDPQGAAPSPRGGDPGPTPTSTTSPPSPPSSGCTQITYYRDRDGDGFGGDETKRGCDSPGDEWVTQGGDCNDDDDEVFPGQTKYFATPYEKKSGAKSFDYDCSNKEDQAPPTKTAATACKRVGNTCTGSGYVPVARQSAPGADPLCGATQFQTCSIGPITPIAQCDATVAETEKPVTCR